ncbi:hypothetical protein [Sulfurimonas sp. C5]|nr:hypothetical protein [Sulfurimonas sp. C5]MDH4944270.1 hypothetical protein [Sulfurimonas sp. C5]
MDATSTQIKEMQKELDKYKSGDSSTTKELLQSMKDSSSWLKEKLEK